MFKKIILLFGILLFSNGAVATDIGVHPQTLLQNLAQIFLSKVRNSQATAPQFQRIIEESDFFNISEIGKICAQEINDRIGKNKNISGNDYLVMYNSCLGIAQRVSIESWREEWVNYDYASQKATPREFLIDIYSVYLYTRACYLNREDYQIQYITHGEFEDIKQKISEFEKSVNSSLIDISLENFWTSAMEKLNGAQLIAGAKKDTTYNENSKVFCQGSKQDFYAFINANSTPEKLKKDF